MKSEKYENLTEKNWIWEKKLRKKFENWRKKPENETNSDAFADIFQQSNSVWSEFPLQISADVWLLLQPN